MSEKISRPEEFGAYNRLNDMFAIAASVVLLKQSAGDLKALQEFSNFTETIRILLSVPELEKQAGPLAMMAYFGVVAEFYIRASSLQDKEWVENKIGEEFPELSLPEKIHAIDFSKIGDLSAARIEIHWLMAAKAVAEGTVLLNQVKALAQNELADLKDIAKRQAQTTPPGNLPASLQSRRDQALRVILAL